MKKRYILIETYISMLFFDILGICINPLLPQDKKEKWSELRRKSRAFYKIMKIITK